MAEAFAALSIAANIAQFVDYARQLISGGKEIYNSLDGMRNEHQALKIIIEDIKNLSEESQPTQINSQPSLDEMAFRKLATECGPLADQLLATLKDLEVPKDVRLRGLHTIRQTIRGIGKKKDIEDLQGRVMSIDVRLRERASKMLQKNYHSSLTSAINTLIHTNEQLKVNTDVNLKELKGDIVKTLNTQKEATAKGLEIGLDNFSKQLLTLAEEGQRIAQQHIILQTLIFEEMEQREDTIKDAHKATLNWMFQENETNFVEWLEAENGIYWVKGKAGSGKSTLMKYICNHQTTLDNLRCWAGSAELFTASFFFWSSGFPMQKSQAGLLQSLLYQVLRACPSLIMEVCPLKGAREPWKRKEIFDTLKRVSGQTALPAKFCFFVDGLDEYDGDDDIIALLQDLAASPCVKICVSSRPWNAFLDAFDNSKWKLVLENFTKDDMREYAHGMLVKDRAFSRMANHDPRCATLVPQIVQKAQGVWLWVYLVVRDLLRDLKGEEEFPLLQRRLDSFPDELERYFENIIDRIDKIHREETARIFLFAVTAVQPFPLLSLKYLSMEADDRDYALRKELAPISNMEAIEIKRKWTKLLNSRCRDLLEVQDINGQKNQHPLSCRVNFLHRTVRDFLKNNYHEKLRTRAGIMFDARASLCKTIIALSKTFTKPTALDTCCIIQYLKVEKMLFYAKDFERTEGQSLTKLLDELGRINNIRFNDLDTHWTNRQKLVWRRAGFEEHGHCILARAIQTGLRLYVKKKLEANRALIGLKLGRPLLDYGCRPERKSIELSQLGQEEVVDAQMVGILLEHGADPNERIEMYGGSTVWENFCLNCFNTFNRLKDDPAIKRLTSAWFEAFELMIEHRANFKGEVATAEDMPERLSVIFTESRAAHAENMPTTLDVIFTDSQAAHLKLRMQQVAERSQPSRLWEMAGWT